ncbi:MAG: hypothetical protein HW406_1563 [Candidatus Brocadiaceae bacterium]|nr:hypothetical protein [Candidatus Brocadiaceae bacterium]
MKNSELAKSLFYKGKPVASISTSDFITGKIISYLCSKYHHFYSIDRVKQSGAKESIEELRKNRISEGAEGTVYDYAPFYKHIISKNGMKHIFEVFCQEQYDFLTKETSGVSQYFDEMLCDMVKKQDSRRDLSFGNDIKASAVFLIVRFGTNEKEISLQLLPKYKNLVMNIKDQYTLIDASTDKREKEDETQEAIIGLYNGAITWDKNKGAVSSWFKQKTEWHLGDAFNKVSDVDPKTNERKLMERIESEGGSLDVPPDKPGESGETKGTQVKDDRKDPIDEQVSHKEDLAWLEKALEKYPKMKAIIEKEKKNEPLTSAERQYKKWFIDKHK